VLDYLNFELKDLPAMELMKYWSVPHQQCAETLP